VIVSKKLTASELAEPTESEGVKLTPVVVGLMLAVIPIYWIVVPSPILDKFPPYARSAVADVWVMVLLTILLLLLVKYWEKKPLASAGIRPFNLLDVVLGIGA
jgi:hypothetical protein